MDKVTLTLPCEVVEAALNALDAIKEDGCEPHRYHEWYSRAVMVLRNRYVQAVKDGQTAVHVVIAPDEHDHSIQEIVGIWTDERDASEFVNDVERDGSRGLSVDMVPLEAGQPRVTRIVYIHRSPEARLIPTPRQLWFEGQVEIWREWTLPSGRRWVVSPSPLPEDALAVATAYWTGWDPYCRVQVAAKTLELARQGYHFWFERLAKEGMLSGQRKRWVWTGQEWIDG